MSDPWAQRMTAGNGTRNGGAAGIVFLTIFGLFWCSFVGMFDFVVARNLFWQAASTWFTGTPAHIVASDVTSRRGSKGGITYGFAVEYTYAVNGRTFTGKRFTFDNSSSSDRDWAYQARNDFPAGSERVCYYDPQNPERAILAPGIHGSDIAILMFLTPFNIVAGFLAALPIFWWRNKQKPQFVEPRIADRLHGREAFAMKRYYPAVTFFAILLLTSFVGIFVTMIPSGFHPSVWRVGTIWGMGFAISAGVTIHLQRKLKAGRYDLVMDYGSRSVTVPALYKREAAEVIPMARVNQFETVKVDTGFGKDRRVSWQVNLVDRDQRHVLVHESFLQPEAERLVETLNAKLKG